METIYLTNDEIASYPIFVDGSNEADIYEFNDKELLKIFRAISDNKMITLEWIEKLELEFKFVPELLIFKKYVHDEFGKIGIVLDKGYKTPLSKLSLSNTSLSDLIQIYKNIEKLLEKLQYLREKEKILTTFFIGDMHEGNILVDLPSKKIQICDLDSCKIGDNHASIAKYLGSIALFHPTLSKKYPQDKYTLTNNQNTDLYCYMMMIARTFFGRSLTFSSEDSFYQTINYLKTQGLTEPLYQALLRLYTPVDNLNPYPCLDDLGEVLEKKTEFLKFYDIIFLGDDFMDCLFCKIINGEIPSYKIYEDEVVIAFLDIHPRSNGHTLIIPKQHFTDFTELDSETILHIHMVAKNITTLLEEKLGATGFCINTNYLDTQEIKHFHLHVVPSSKEKLKDVEEIYNKLK